jgi:hypothetical protein
MSTPSQDKLTRDKDLSILLMWVAGIGTVIWVPFSGLLAFGADSGMTPAISAFLTVAWYGPAIATIVGIIAGNLGIKKKTGRAWVSVLISTVSAPVAIVVMGLIAAAAPLPK